MGGRHHCQPASLPNPMTPWRSTTSATCQTAVLAVTVVDVLRIARGLVLNPWEFVRLIPAPATAQPAPFVLDNSDSCHQLVLGSANSAATCPFLLHTNEGAVCCGLGSSLRPPCQRPAEQYGAVDLSIHLAVAQGWNAYAGRWPKEAGLDLTDLSRYVLDAASVLAHQEQLV